MVLFFTGEKRREGRDGEGEDKGRETVRKGKREKVSNNLVIIKRLK